MAEYFLVLGDDSGVDRKNFEDKESLINYYDVHSGDQKQVRLQIVEDGQVQAYFDNSLAVKNFISILKSGLWEN